ncbi:asparagine synthase [Nocardiopsis sp. Huas11]|nr:asparagine synthase [Nocardiopsis sp. Huas11]
MTALVALAGAWARGTLGTMQDALAHRATSWEQRTLGGITAAGGTNSSPLPPPVLLPFEGGEGFVVVDAPAWLLRQLPSPRASTLTTIDSVVSWLGHLKGDAHAVVVLPGHRLVAYRGPASARPLFYSTGPEGRLAVATRPDALTSAVPATVDLVGLAAYLIPQMCDPHGSPWQGVHRLPPGHTLIRDNGEITVTPAEPLAARDVAGADQDQLVGLFRDALFTAVERCSGTSDALLLSGGIDSSSLAGVYAATGLGPVRAYGLTYTAPLTACDERAYARDVAALTGLTFEELPANDLLPLSAPYPMGHEPEAWSYAGRNWAMLNHITQRPVPPTTVLAGEGGDELLLGQVFAIADRIAHGDAEGGWREADTLPDPARGRAVLTHLLTGDYDTPRARLQRALGEVPSWFTQAWMDEAAVLPRLTSSYPQLGEPGSMTTAYSRGLFAEAGAAGRAQCGGWWEDTGRRAGVAITYPFLDPDLAALTWSLPPVMFRDGGLEKAVLRQALDGYLPESVARRPDKAEALTILNAGLLTNQAQLRALAKDSPLIDLGVLDPHRFETGLDRYLSGDHRHAPALWALHAVHEWLLAHERHLP